MSMNMSVRMSIKVSMKMSMKKPMLTMMMNITIDDDHDGHDDDVILAGWGSFEASNFSLYFCSFSIFALYCY